MWGCSWGKACFSTKLIPKGLLTSRPQFPSHYCHCPHSSSHGFCQWVNLLKLVSFHWPCTAQGLSSWWLLASFITEDLTTSIPLPIFLPAPLGLLPKVQLLRMFCRDFFCGVPWPALPILLQAIFLRTVYATTESLQLVLKYASLFFHSDNCVYASLPT